MKIAALLPAAVLAVFACAANAAVLKLVERATGNVIAVHGGTASDNVGDILTFSNPVFDVANTRKLGFDQGFCVRLVIGKSYECHWTLSLAQGQIAVDGPFLDAGDSDLAVTGGTGAYNGVRGQMHLHARDAKGSAYDYTYDLK